LFSEKLLTLLRRFDKYGLNRLRKFLMSPYFNEQADVVAFFECLNEALRRDDGGLLDLDKRTVWAFVYPDKLFDEAQLRRIASELMQLTLQFMAVEGWQQNPYAAGLELQLQLAQPELEKHLAGVERQLQRISGNRAGKTSDDYLSLYRMHWNAFSRSTGTLISTGYAEKLMPADRALDCFYAIQKLKFYVSWLIYKRLRPAPDDMPLIEGFWDFLDREQFSNEPLINLYRQVALSLAHFDDENRYHVFVDSLETVRTQISEAEYRSLYQFAQNYCALKINQGRTAYYNELFRIFKILIDKNLLLEDGSLSEGLYKNIITVGLRVGEYELAEQFIQSHAAYLPAHIRENARTFNLANLYSHQHRHDKVIELLRNVEYSDVVYALSAKLILVRTYYESDEFNALDSLIDSFRIYLRRNKLISKSVKNQYLQFLRFVRKLISLRPGDAAGLSALRAEIADCEPLMSKKWLLEKVEEF